MLSLIESLSDISRTNQVKINHTPEEVADLLYQYLFKKGKGIEHFSINGWQQTERNGSVDYYQNRHKYIKEQIRQRLLEYGKVPDYSSIQYFFSYSDGKNNVFFLSPKKDHSGWKQLFCEKWSTNRERIFNLIFKFFILSQNLSIETISGFEELLFPHTSNLSKSEDALITWGQNLYVHYNYYDVLTLTLSRKRRVFLPQEFATLDGDHLGEIQIYQKKKYYYNRDLDARRKNPIYFMGFGDENPPYKNFKKTQLYYYQRLMNELENFLRECKISYTPLNFQANYYLENPFIDSKTLKSLNLLKSLVIINNTGADLSERDQLFLRNFFFHQGIEDIIFFNSGNSISQYEKVAIENDNDTCWRITETIPWSGIELDKDLNYLILNKRLEEENGSMAYQREDGLWISSTDIDEKERVDFYSQLKRRYNFFESGEFYCTQGINIDSFFAIGNQEDKSTILKCASKRIDKDALNLETRDYTDGLLLDPKEAILSYLIRQKDPSQWGKFCKKFKIKVSSEFQKILIELRIKSWIRDSLTNPNLGLQIDSQQFNEKRFFAVYVRSPRKQTEKVIAVEFLYKDSNIYITDIIYDMEVLKKRFPFLKRRKNTDELKDDQKYFVDEAEQIYISYYTDDKFSPTLIGRNGIIEELDAGTLKIDRKISGENSARLLPVVSYYNNSIRPINRIRNMICFDLKNDSFIQYYVPHRMGLDQKIQRGFRVYHLIGKKYKFSKEAIPTSELIKNPIVALHFNTLTQDILKINDNSQSSLLQKVAKVFIEN